MPTIIIIGGGFAGTSLTRKLVGRLPFGWNVLLISEESYTTYNPLLPEVVGASIFPDHAVAPLREAIGQHPDARFVMGKVTSVDFTRRNVTCETLSGARHFEFAELVFALGNRARLDLLPGMREHALPLKTIGDALHVRNVALRRLAMIELEHDPMLRLKLGHFVVIGGGFSGVEVAGALHDFLKSSLRHYPRVRRAEIKVTVVQNIDRILPELPEALSEKALVALKKRGVEFRLGAVARSVDADGVQLQEGEKLESKTTISTVGTISNDLIAGLALPASQGRISVSPNLEVLGFPGVWALGDCASVVNTMTGKVSPTTAQFAIAQANHLAENLIATLNHAPTRPFSYRAKGIMASTGHLDGVAEVGGLQVSGLVAWLLWRAYYLLQAPTMRRKVRLFGEWTWGMFFTTDITHFRFLRSGEDHAKDF